jgi:hypothetical protein
MRKLLISTSSLFLLSISSASWGVPINNAANDLCSPQGIAKLVPQMRGPHGQFQVPDPTKNLPKFLQAYSALRAVISATLAQAEQQADPYTVANQKFRRLRFGPKWWAAEVGFVSDAGKAPDYRHKKFGDYGHASFMNGIIPVKGTSGSFYTVPGKAVFIAPMPTLLKCVNLVMETSGQNSGTFISPSFALGTKSGKVFMLVNGCQNTSQSININKKPALLSPGGSSYLGIQIAGNIGKNGK